jgi:hypothetical protein
MFVMKAAALKKRLRRLKEGRGRDEEDGSQ